ncbi:MAG: glycosyltransferase family 2 protein [Clostridia bacterium]|nr:glycosyltransferase family 2 protein [Clostridia bacterium]
MEKLSIVVPCYNEETVIEIFYNKLMEITAKISDKYDYEVIFVDDGSQDETFSKMKALREKNSKIKIISFSRNFGKEAGIHAGLSNSTGELTVVMDADMQHPPEMILEMLKYIEEGYDTVTTRRKNRKGEPIIKSFCARMFYKLINKFMEVKLEEGSQDFRMMKRNVVDAILSLNEYNRFSKGIFNWVGFKCKYIEIENVKRAAGKTKWSFSSLWRYAMEGITSFTTAPLKIATFIGMFVFIVSTIFAFTIVIQTLIMGKDVPGYASTIVSVLFMGAIQLLCIGILSEYISKMYMEIKNRPKYIIRDKIDNENK